MKKEWKMFWFGILISIGFVAVIGVLGYRFDSIELLPDQGASWYYWKLPNKEFWPRLTAWAFYIIHQLLVWLLIYAAQFGDREKRKKHRNQLIIVNIFFIALHILQSHIWYDGLAQDVPVFSSQGSVIVMLILIIIMDSQRRGIFFGKKVKRLPIIGSLKEPVTFIRKYHGYFISWAIVYTFWYHPTVATSGHLVGFFYMFLLFIQLSMIYTPVHMNKYWMFTLEVLVLFHGTMVAIGQQNNMWPMFLFGFATMAVVTQIYGLGLPKWLLRTIQAIYLIGVIVVFGGFTGHKTIDQVHQVLWIPIIEYLVVFVVLYGVGGIQKLVKRD
ncbi:hypothetical protein [Vallitalea pronyensis]|nr:hypothetical protein [Vallitalea pronyensis]